jgi:hypothetical protein
MCLPGKCRHLSTEVMTGSAESCQLIGIYALWDAAAMLMPLLCCMNGAATDGTPLKGTPPLNAAVVLAVLVSLEGRGSPPNAAVPTCVVLTSYIPPPPPEHMANKRQLLANKGDISPTKGALSTRSAGTHHALGDAAGNSRCLLPGRSTQHAVFMMDATAHSEAGITRRWWTAAGT